jgi:aspartate racemase
MAPTAGRVVVAGAEHTDGSRNGRSASLPAPPKNRLAKNMKMIGVLGGMGPAATADFFTRLVVAVGATHDQAHPEVLIYSAAKIPDRTTHLLAGGEDPTDALQAAARLLEAGGAGLIAIPCNSAHAYHRVIQEAVSIPVLDMIGLTARTLRASYPEGTRVGVLAATGTIRLGLYDRSLSEVGLKAIVPDDPSQEGVMGAVRAIKGGHRGEDFRLDRAISELVAEGAEVLVLGCTEIPLAVAPDRQPVPVVDATTVLIESTLRESASPSPEL